MSNLGGNKCSSCTPADREPRRGIYVQNNPPALVGLGNVGRSFLGLMVSKSDLLRDRYGLELVLTGAADSSGAVMEAGGIDPAALREHKARGGNAGNFVTGVPGMSARSWPPRRRPICCLRHRWSISRAVSPDWTASAQPSAGE